MQTIVGSAPLRWFVRVGVRPAMAAGALWWIVPVLGAGVTVSAVAGGVLFVGANLLLGSRWGQDVEEIVVDGAARAWKTLRARIIPGLVRWTLDVFRRLVDRFERGLYAVEEWLHFRGGQGPVALVAKAVLGLVWFAFTFVVRLYVTLLIEPQINPIKHFPVVTVSHKVIIPFSLTLTALAAKPLEPVLGVVLANTIAGMTVFLLPGVFGFLVWELKANWRLYEANRAPNLGPVVVGSHGETMARLLRPGFHSGTLPKLYARMRRAQRRGRGRRDVHVLRRARADIHHVAEAVERFACRDLVATLHNSGCLGLRRIDVAHVTPASNRVQIAVAMNGSDTPFIMAFEEQSGLLVARISRAGWLASLDARARAVVRNALIGFYKGVGVDLVREHVATALGGGRRCDVAEGSLVVWGAASERVIYPLARRGTLQARRWSGASLPAWARPVDAEDVFFAAHPVSWDAWVAALDGARQGCMDGDQPAANAVLGAGDEDMAPAPLAGVRELLPGMRVLPQA